jgi:hypothetical protein
VRKTSGYVDQIADELFDEELALIDRAIYKRSSHLRSVDALDIPDRKSRKRKTCPTNKRKFRDKKEADRVLHYIMNTRNEREALGMEYRFKQYRSYQCPCGSWHHSSRPELGDREFTRVAV